MLSLSASHHQKITCHAERTYPEECCGILLGTIDRQANQAQLVEVLETENAWSKIAIADLAIDLPEIVASGRQVATSRRDRYWIDPRDLLKAQQSGRDRGLQVIGIYHSHPDHPAIPSECDRRLAWAEYVYVIVSVSRSQSTVSESKTSAQAEARSFECWRLNAQHQFLPEAIAIDDAAG